MALVSYTALLVGWLVVFALLLFVLLFGEAEMFEGTFVERLHWILTDGVPYGLSWVLRKVIGDARAGKIEALAQEVLCERPNPAMQLVYVALVMGGYWVYCVHVEPLILAGAVSASHAIVVPVAMFFSIASWLAVCFSDPGVVDAYTLDAQLAAYPHDHVLYKPKTCPTLGVTCPARSKYCRVTQRRVAKFDHYCGWMGNAIGENNLRYFVTFLAVHVVLTMYGSWLCASAISGEIGRRGLWSAEFEPTRRRRGGGKSSPDGVSRLASDRGLLARFVAYHFSPAATLSLFLAILAVMLGAFLLYHLWLIHKGVTTNESFKWSDYERFLRRTAEARVEAVVNNPFTELVEKKYGETETFEADDDRDVGCVGPSASKKDLDGGGGGDQRASSSPGKASTRSLLARAFGLGKPKKLKVDLPPNIYRRASFVLNLKDVFVPPSHAHMRRLELGVRDKKRQ
jgi:palmitoyltransferase